MVPIDAPFITIVAPWLQAGWGVAPWSIDRLAQASAVVRCCENHVLYELPGDTFMHQNQ